MATFYEKKLEAAQQRLTEFEARHFPGGRIDHGALNLPVEKRQGNIHAQIDQWKALTGAVEYWGRKIRADRRRAEAPAIREARAERHDAADLKARYGDCEEVLWTLAGRWFPVKRWNRKSVTVEGLTETIPHTQVGGAR